MSDADRMFAEQPRVEWRDGRPFATTRLDPEYAQELEQLALDREKDITALPISGEWHPIAHKNPTTARFSNYSSFLLSPATLPLFFAIRATYRRLLEEMGEKPQPRFIQCWYNIHRCGNSLVRHKHNYPFIGTFSAHSRGSETRYGRSQETSDSDAVLQHIDGQLMVTTGDNNYHETSVWLDATRPRVTYAFDIVNRDQWKQGQIFLPFDA